ncbi:MAG: TIGR00288 family NYN domain-containing protein [DPANN group archaeon]|nr:TIGR00288 family NYN domain-containing protein [DPANN group archaeon]
MLVYKSVIIMFGFLKKLFKTRKNIALIIDGPNLLRKEFNIDLRVILKDLGEYGNVRMAKVLLNQFAPAKLVEAISNEGFEAIVGFGEKKNDIASDVDVYVAMAAVEAIYSKHFDIIALATRDADFLPVIQLAKAKGKEVIIMGQEPGFSKALQNSADCVLLINKGKNKNKLSKN